MKHMVAAAVAVITLGAAVLPAGAQEAAPVAVSERSVECRAVDAERAYRGTQRTATGVAVRGDGLDDWRAALAALEVRNDDGRTLRQEFHHRLADWAEHEGWRIVSDRRLDAARDRCDAERPAGA